VLDRRTLASEIDDIRAGRWDNEIAQELGISSQNAATTAVQVQEHEDSPSTHPLNAVEVQPLQKAEVDEDESLQDKSGGQA
jgi:bromodomain-containing protein 8